MAKDVLEEFQLLVKERDESGSARFAPIVYDLVDEIRHLRLTPKSIPMLLTCPSCGERHVDEGEFAEKAHHTHACPSCGMIWRPAIVPTVGVRFLPGFKNA